MGGATGRYHFECAIIGAFRFIKLGKGAELQFAGAIDLLLSESHPVSVVVHDGIRHGLDIPAGFIPTKEEYDLGHPNYGWLTR